MSDSILSDNLWRRIKPLLPKAKKRRDRQHAGRKPADARAVLTGIVFVLKTGVPWKHLPATSDFPSGHTCRRRLLEWHARGVWRRLWRDILAELQAQDDRARVKIDLTVATYALFGMMNWIYNWYDPAGALSVADLVDNVTRLFLHGFGNPADADELGFRPAAPTVERLSVWRGAAE